MDIHILEVYLGLCRNLHFGRTSEEFHMSASALSRLIQKLEHQIGAPLFDRDNRSVALTEAGKQFREFATETHGNWRNLQMSLASEDAELSGRLSIFATVTASQSILPEVLKQFRMDYPQIQIELETGYAVSAIKRLSEGVDVVVTSLDDQENEKITRKTITSIPMVTITSDSNFGRIPDEEINWAEVPLILPTAGPIRKRIELWFKAKGIQPKIYSEVPGNEAILSLTALGCGLGFVPSLVLKNSPLGKALTVITVGPQLENINVGFCVRKKSLLSSKIIQAFWHSV